jgi:hypothetical protein
MGGREEKGWNQGAQTVLAPYFVASGGPSFGGCRRSSGLGRRVGLSYHTIPYIGILCLLFFSPLSPLPKLEKQIETRKFLETLHLNFGLEAKQEERRKKKNVEKM